MLKVVPAEKTYEASTFAERLGVSSSTLRNYKSQFAKAGMTFRNNKGKTIYTEHDFILFNEMLSLHRQGGKTIKDCVLSVLSIQDTQSAQEHQDDIKDNTNTLKAVQDAQDRQDSNRESSISIKQYEDIITRLDGQEKEIQKFKAQIERRDRQITELMRQIQQLKKEVAAKKKWWKFWSKEN